MKENLIQINVGMVINADVSVTNYAWNFATCSCENKKYLAIIMNDPAIMQWRSRSGNYVEWRC